MASEDDEFAMFFNELFPGLCRFVECMVGRQGAAQDVAQESFLRLYRAGLRSFPEGEARFWLYRVARNLALNELDKGHTRQRLSAQAAEASRPAERTPQGELEMTECREIVLTMLKSLPEHQRSALLLREQEEMSYREIASVLGISEGKVKVDVFRARTALREKWGRALKASANTAG